MSCGGSHVEIRCGSGCGSSTISVPSSCVHTSGCGGGNAYIQSSGCGGGYSGEVRWVSGGCGSSGYYEPTSSGGC